MKFLCNSKTLLGRLFAELCVLDKVKSNSNAEVLYHLIKEDMSKYVCSRSQEKSHPISIREFFKNPEYRQKVREKIIDEINELKRIDESISQYGELVC